MASVVKLEPSVWIQELDGILKVKEVLGISVISVKKPTKCGQSIWEWSMSLISPLLHAGLVESPPLLLSAAVTCHALGVFQLLEEPLWQATTSLMPHAISKLLYISTFSLVGNEPIV